MTKWDESRLIVLGCGIQAARHLSQRAEAAIRRAERDERWVAQLEALD